jgi:hypothetical protein
VYVTSASAISLLTKLDDKAEAMRWSEPRLVLSQEHGAEDGARGIPKVGALSQMGFQQRRWRAAERGHPTGRERIDSATIQTLHDPILLAPWLGFRGGGFPPCEHRLNARSPSSVTLQQLSRSREVSAGRLLTAAHCSPPPTVLQVIANSMAVLSNGDWALPFWREQPHKSAKGAGSLCHVDNPQKEAALTSAGVLLSSDFGRSWTPHGTLTHPHTVRPNPNPQPRRYSRSQLHHTLHALSELPERNTSFYTPRLRFLTSLKPQGLIEGSLVELLPEDRRWHVEAAGNSTAAPVLKMFYRTRAGCAFMTDSADGGRIWSAAAPVNLPNPNTKFHVVQLQPSGHLAVAFNDHARGQFCKVRGGMMWHPRLRAGSPPWGGCWSQRCTVRAPRPAR